MKNVYDSAVKIRCSKIVYDPEFAVPGMKKSMTVYIDRDFLSCAARSSEYGDSDVDTDEISEFVRECIEEITDCPVLEFSMTK